MKYLILFLLSAPLIAQPVSTLQEQVLQAKYQAALADAKRLYAILAPLQEFQDYLKLANQELPALQRQLQQAQQDAAPKSPQPAKK